MKLSLKDDNKIKEIKPIIEEEVVDNWSLISKIIESPDSDSIQTSIIPMSPPITTLDLKDKAIFGVRPLEQINSQNIIKCKDCNKPVLESALESHSVNCSLIREKQKKKAEASQDQASRKRGVSEVSDSNPSPPKKSVTSFTLTHNKSTNNLTAPLLVKKDSSRGKQRASAVDVDIHCGVMLDKGYPCSRSLTCKTHSMGSKRAVPHRSLPYDTLLINWQKANKSDELNGSGSMNGNNGNGIGGSSGGGSARKQGGGRKDGSTAGSSGRKRRKSGDTASGAGGLGGLGKEGRHGERRTVREKGKSLLVVGEWEEEEGEDESAMMIDSDEEVEKVMEALQKGPIGRPLGLGSGIGSMSAFAGRNLKLARLRSVLGGLFGKHD